MLRDDVFELRMGIEHKRRGAGVVARSSWMYELINRVRGHVRRFESLTTGPVGCVALLCPHQLEINRRRSYHSNSSIRLTSSSNQQLFFGNNSTCQQEFLKD